MNSRGGALADTAPQQASVPPQRTPERTRLTPEQVHAARNSLQAVRVATHCLAELGPSLPPQDRQQLHESIESEIKNLQELLTS